MVVTIHNNQVADLEKLDYDMINDFSRSIQGTFGITIGLSAHVRIKAMKGGGSKNTVTYLYFFVDWM
jgi:hypothetical protein